MSRAGVGLAAFELLGRHVLESARGSFRASVSGLARLRQRRQARGAGHRVSRAAAWSFARPKSRSFTPDFVSMTLPGFKSRWTIPCRCALSSASAISMP